VERGSVPCLARLSAAEATAIPLFVVTLLSGHVTALLGYFGFQCDSREKVDRIAAMTGQQGLLLSSPVTVTIASPIERRSTIAMGSL